MILKNNTKYVAKCGCVFRTYLVSGETVSAKCVKICGKLWHEITDILTFPINNDEHVDDCNKLIKIDNTFNCKHKNMLCDCFLKEKPNE